MTKHVLILGGGPAGTATALALRNHTPDISITLVESTDYSQIRIGETLPPQVQQLLVHLGVWPAFLERHYKPSFGTCAAWGSSELLANEFFLNIYNRGWHLDRRDFDAFLAAEAGNRGVQVCTETKMTSHQRNDDDRWPVTLHNQTKGSWHEEADFIVDATGRLGLFARAQDAEKERYDQLVGLFHFFDVEQSTTGSPQLADSTLVEAVEDGWWYSSLLPNAQRVVAYMSDADLVGQNRLKDAAQWRDRIERTAYTQQRIPQARAFASMGSPRIYAAHTQKLDKAFGSGWLAVGDAASTFDPLSSQGVFKALRSGIFAAYAVSDHLQGDAQALIKYQTFVDREFAGYRQKWRDYYEQERRWPHSPFWQRRHAV